MKPNEQMVSVIGCDPGPTNCAVIGIQGPALSSVGMDTHRAELMFVGYPSVKELMSISTWRCHSALVEMVNCFHTVLAVEKVTSRFGMNIGSTTFDTCRNSGIVIMSLNVGLGFEKIYCFGNVDWRIPVTGCARGGDSKTRLSLLELYGDEFMKELDRKAKELKTEYSLAKPIGCHLRDALGVATGVSLIPSYSGESLEHFCFM